MGQILIGVADFRVSRNFDDLLITYALGSCIAVTVFDAKAKVGGLLHFMLADSSLDKQKAAIRPAMFADTGIPLLFKCCYQMGAEKRRIRVKVAGGASIMDKENHFQIGQKNITAVRKIFWKNKVFVDGEDTGGDFNRTVRLDIATGITRVSNSKGYEMVI
ncbi:MAG: chemotaxis protein CheD [Syntrophales bacterium]|jgi:chemotaxis protein CheD|nr:chemotaxis protein CheD [Syntrophales bacterium]MDY0043362.1 chemotaxis protein CheD [Syntrophales bacterium]